MTGDTSRNCDTPVRSSIQILQIFCIKLCTVSLSFCLLGCTSPIGSDNSKPIESPAIPKDSSPAPTIPLQTKPTPLEDLAQYLPIEATAMIAGREFKLEVAKTPKQQEKGLMFRPPLDDDRGMLFPFIPARQVAFWMKNTPSPLDIIFLLNGEVKAIARNVTICKSDPCPIYPADGVIADNVIEIRAGLTEKLGLKEGDQITIKFLLPKNQ